MERFMSILYIILKILFSIAVVFVVSCQIIFFLVVLFLWIVSDPGDDIYDDTHYYCGDNYEIYIASAGATDKFHYYVKEEKEILLFGKFEIVYTKEEEKTKDDYDYILENYECSLVGEDNG